MNKFIKNLPKVELHCHLDGSVPINTLKKFSENSKLIDQVAIKNSCKDLKEYLKSFDIILRYLQTKENLSIATYDIIKSLQEDKVEYIELRFAPLLHMDKGLSIEDVIESVSIGLDRAKKDFSTYVNLIICCMRHHEENQNLKLIKEIIKINNKYVKAFDFAGYEGKEANKKLKTLIEYIKNAGYFLTIHSGETGFIENVYDAINFNAQRIGHGLVAAKDDKLLDLSLKENIHYEFSIKSNYQTGAIKDYKEFPLEKFIDKNISFSINTDNRTVSFTNLNEELERITEIFNLDINKLIEIQKNSIISSFGEDYQKNKIIKDLDFYKKSINNL